MCRCRRHLVFTSWAWHAPMPTYSDRSFHGGRFPNNLQHNHWASYFERHLGNHLNLPSFGQVPRGWRNRHPKKAKAESHGLYEEANRPFNVNQVNSMLFGNIEVSSNKFEKSGEPHRPCPSSSMPNSATKTSSSIITNSKSLDSMTLQALGGMALQAIGGSSSPKSRKYYHWELVAFVCFLSKEFSFSNKQCNFHEDESKTIFFFSFISNFYLLFKAC